MWLMMRGLAGVFAAETADMLGTATGEGPSMSAGGDGAEEGSSPAVPVAAAAVAGDPGLKVSATPD